MAGKSKGSGGGEAARRARVEELKRAQKAAERRKTLMFGAVGGLLAVVLIGLTISRVAGGSDDAEAGFAAIGVPAAQAGCDAVLDSKASVENLHTQDPEKTITYDTVPPTSGEHFVTPAQVNDRGFYTAADRPRIEQLVHNLEHGYTIVWYLPSVPEADLEPLRTLAEKLRNENKYRKFLVAPWDTSRGKFAGGKDFALSHWSAGPKQGEAGTGRRQFCSKVSGEAVVTFLDAYPSKDSRRAGRRGLR